MPVQVPLPFVFQGNQDFDSYFAGPNQQVLESLKALAGQENRDGFLFIRGASGLGKSHLLQATCRAASRIGRSAFFLPCGECTRLGPEMLEGLENYRLVCVDDIESIAGKSDWESAFFHFFNRHREKSNNLVVSATLPPHRLPVQLRDLASRLCCGLTLELKEMGDADKLGALTFKAKQLGFSLPQEVGRFLLNRYPRDLPSLWKILETLDYATLSEQRKLTIPFLKNHLPER
jgi:DnaA family protein